MTAAGGGRKEQFCGGEKERKEPAQATHRESAKRGGLTDGILRFAQDDSASCHSEAVRPIT